jgi:hypothetical protein
MVQVRVDEIQGISFRKSEEKRAGANLDTCARRTTLEV